MHYRTPATPPEDYEAWAQSLGTGTEALMNALHLAGREKVVLFMGGPPPARDGEPHPPTPARPGSVAES